MMNRFFKIFFIGLFALLEVLRVGYCSNLEFPTTFSVIPVYTYQVLNTYPHDQSAFTEGWGITYDGNCLIMSDGTSTLHFLDPETFEEISQIEVHENDIPVTKINELEYVQGEIFANIWLTERIARINPLTGQVTGWIDLKGILSPEDCSEKVDVLNGIAYDAKNNRLLVTGKFWPKLFEIELIKDESNKNGSSWGQ